MSRSASLILAAVLGGVVVGGIVWVTRPAVAPAPQVVGTPAPATTAPLPRANHADAVQAQAPPWADGAGVVSGPTATSLAAAVSVSPRDPEKAKQRAAIRARLHQLTTNGRHATPAEMNDVLADLERVEGSPIIAGVNIGALRSNLVAVDKLQKLSMALQTESQKPGGGDKQKIQDILAQLKQVQESMHINVGAAAQTTVPHR